MDTQIPTTDHPKKKYSKFAMFWIFLVIFCLLMFVITMSFLGWFSYNKFQEFSEKANSPYATATALAQWPVIFSDNFGKVSDPWYVGTYSGNGYREKRSISDGVYTWEFENSVGYIFWELAKIGGLKDFVLSVDVRHTAGTINDGYGLIFRFVAENYYTFSIQDQSTYKVSLRSAGKWNTIISPTYSNAIKPGEFNHLMVQAQGDTFRFFINGQYICEFKDETLGSGDAGMMVNPHNEPFLPETKEPQGISFPLSGSVSRVVFDNLEVRAQDDLQTTKNRPAQLPEIRPGLGKLVFASDRDHNRNIYTINTDGSGIKQLTDNPAEDFAPRWSPDGKKITFVSKRDGNSEIYVMDANGENLIRLTDNLADDVSPDWSPDGKQIIFASNRNSDYDIFLMSAAGEKTSLVQIPKAYDQISPVISPDGSHILFQSKKKIIYDLRIMEINGKGVEIIGVVDNRTAADGAWSPDGLKVAYIKENIDGTNDIFVNKIDTAIRYSDDGQITQNMGKNQFPNWSPDGNQLVIVSDRDGQPDIYILLPDGTGIFRVTHNEAMEESPDWTIP